MTPARLPLALLLAACAGQPDPQPVPVLVTCERSPAPDAPVFIPFCTVEDMQALTLELEICTVKLDACRYGDR
jgi:hypothetical protein